MKKLLFLIIAAIVIASCHKEETLHPYKWETTESGFDSVAMLIEHQFNEFYPSDSIKRNISVLDSLAETGEKNMNVKRSRAKYWHAKILSRIGKKDSSLKIVKEAMLLNDSLAYRYDYLRLKSLELDLDETIDGAEKYRRYHEFIEYAGSIGDDATVAMISIQLGNLLGDIGEFEQGLHQLKLSDKLNDDQGFHRFAVKNKVNIIRLLMQSGHSREADSLMRVLIDHPVIAEDKVTHNFLLRYLYYSTGEVGYLREALKETMEENRLRHLSGFYYTMLADYYFNKDENSDSAIMYANLGVMNLPATKYNDHRALILLNKSIADFAESKPDSAYLYRVEYENVMDSVRENARGQEIIKLGALREAGFAEARYNREIYRRNMILAVLAIVLIAAGGVLLFWLNRRHLRQKIANMETEMALEKTKRKITASTLTIQEMDNLLGVLRDELSEIRSEGSIGETIARRLESTIKMHLSEKESSEVFTDMFDVVNPAFTQRLCERCGELADSYVKLACYTLMGLDNKRIGRLMMIKPESVRQARWRLRQRLNLSDDETLEEVLKRMNTPDGK